MIFSVDRPFGFFSRFQSVNLLDSRQKLLQNFDIEYEVGLSFQFMLIEECLDSQAPIRILCLKALSVLE